jgi:hypothetical protein
MVAPTHNLDGSHRAGKRWTIFLSHAKQDQPFVDWLYHKLLSADLTVWYDQNEILVGDSIPGKIAEGLEGSELLIVVLSPASLASRWVREELEPKILEQIGGRDVAILPLALGELDAAQVPALLRGKRRLHFPPTGSDELFRELLADIEQHLMRRGHLPHPQISSTPPAAVRGPNPFGLRGGVDPARFVVPERLVREVTEDISKGLSLSLVGARMIGKTSLLNYLVSERARSYYRDEADRPLALRFVFVDLQAHSGQQRDDLLPALAAAMSDLLPPAARFTGSTHAEALAWIKNTAGPRESGRPRWVLVFDEFDRVLDLAGLDKVFFDELRSLPQHYQVSYVIASRRKLLELPLPRGANTSPFFNLLKEVFLRVWDPATTRTLMLAPRGTPLHAFSEQDITQMSMLTGRHPLLLQIGCYHLFNEQRAAHEQPASADAADAEALPPFQQNYALEAESVYHYYWHNELGDAERAWLTDCWWALRHDNAAVLLALQRNTDERKNETIRGRLARLGVLLSQSGPIRLAEGWLAFLGSRKLV